MQQLSKLKIALKNMTSQQFKTIVGDKLKTKKKEDERRRIAEAVETATAPEAPPPSGVLSRLFG